MHLREYVAAVVYWCSVMHAEAHRGISTLVLFIEIFLSAFRPLKAVLCDIWTTTQQSKTITKQANNQSDTAELITPFHSESTAHSNDINISKNTPKIGKIPLLWNGVINRLGISSKFAIFISVDSPSWAEQNSANDFVIACIIDKIFLYNWSTPACP